MLNTAGRKEDNVNNLSRVRTAKYMYIFFSVCICIYGGLLLFQHEPSVQRVASGIGLLLTLYGCSKIWGYFSRDLYRLAFQHGMATGIFAVAVGIFVVLIKTISAEKLCIILGLTIVMDALTRIEMSLDAKAFGISGWWLIFVIGIVSGTLGFLLIPRPFLFGSGMFSVTGAALLTEGILNIITAALTIHMPTKQHPEDAVRSENSPWGI